MPVSKNDTPHDQPKKDQVDKQSKDEEVTPSLVKHYLELADQAMSTDSEEDQPNGGLPPGDPQAA